MEKNGTARQATDGSIIRRFFIACRVIKAKDTHTHTHTICNTYCFPAATVVKRTLLHVTLYVHYLS